MAGAGLFFVFCFLTGRGGGDLLFIIPRENCTNVFTRNILMVKNEDNGFVVITALASCCLAFNHTPEHHVGNLFNNLLKQMGILLISNFQIGLINGSQCHIPL